MPKPCEMSRKQMKQVVSKNIRDTKTPKAIQKEHMFQFRHQNLPGSIQSRTKARSAREELTYAIGNPTTSVLCLKYEDPLPATESGLKPSPAPAKVASSEHPAESMGWDCNGVVVPYQKRKESPRTRHLSTGSNARAHCRLLFCNHGTTRGIRNWNRRFRLQELILLCTGDQKKLGHGSRATEYWP